MSIMIADRIVVQILLGVILLFTIILLVYFFRTRKSILYLQKENANLNARLATHENDQLFRSFVLTNKHAVIHMDLAGNIILMNRAASEAFARDNSVNTIYDLFPEEISQTLLNKSREIAVPLGHQSTAFTIRQNGREYWYWSVLHPYFNDNGIVKGIHIMIYDFTERKSLEQELYKILKNQEFLVNFSNYLNSTINIDHKIDKVLPILGKYLNIDRIYIYQDSEEGTAARNIHEWSVTGIKSDKELYHRIPYDAQMFDWKHSLIKDGIIYKHNIELLEGNLNVLLSQRDVKSILVLPLYVDSDFFGFIGFDFCKDYHYWEEIEIGFLKTISITISNALERNKKQIELQQSEEKFKGLFNNSSDAILICNTAGEILEVNEVACSLTGYDKELLYHLHFEDILSINQKDKFPELILQSKNESKIIESEFQSNTGEFIPVEINFRTITFNNTEAIISVVRNITERKELERSILRIIMDTEEKERGRIARDLHDGLGPLLSGIKLYVKVMGMSADIKKNEEMVKITNGIVDEAMALIKEITNNLSPHVLIDFGLATAIQSFCKRISLTKAINIKFDSNLHDQRLQSETELVYFRVLKELVNNTLKHASAKNIQIFLLKTEQTLTMLYMDDGIGFDPQKALLTPDGGMGVANIVKRIESIRGNVSIQSKDGSGIQVKIEVGL